MSGNNIWYKGYNRGVAFHACHAVQSGRRADEALPGIGPQMPHVKVFYPLRLTDLRL